MEAFQHVAIYAGVPKANHAIRLARATFAEMAASQTAGPYVHIGLQTQICFEDEDNSADPLLARIDPRPRADTLIARKTGEGRYRFDIRLQGPGETVFLDI